MALPQAGSGFGNRRSRVERLVRKVQEGKEERDLGGPREGGGRAGAEGREAGEAGEAREQCGNQTLPVNVHWEINNY